MRLNQNFLDKLFFRFFFYLWSEDSNLGQLGRKRKDYLYAVLPIQAWVSLISSNEVNVFLQQLWNLLSMQMLSEFSSSSSSTSSRFPYRYFAFLFNLKFLEVMMTRLESQKLFQAFSTFELETQIQLRWSWERMRERERGWERERKGERGSLQNLSKETAAGKRLNLMEKLSYMKN